MSKRNKAEPIVWFDQVAKDDLALVGGKGANLGEMVKAGLPVPPGFMVTSQAYYRFIKKNQLEQQIKDILKPTDAEDPHQLNMASQKIGRLITSAKVPADLAKQIISYYEQMGGRLKKQTLVAVRSSATAEDLPDASFAGQQETFLNVKGEANLVDKIRECWASLFTPRAIFYRNEKNFSHFDLGIAVIVQKMIQADVSGVMFTADPVGKDKQSIIIEAIFGLGELIVQGAVTPDHYRVDRNNFKISKKQINRQKVRLIKVKGSNKKVRLKKIRQEKQKLGDNQIVRLAKLGKKIHQHYFFPQDIEWAMEKQTLYILQTRPITTLPEKDKKVEESQPINLPLIVEGDGASPGLATGFARIIQSAKNIDQLKKGEVLVAPKTTPDYVPAMKRAAGIVTDHGGQTSHAAIVSRELGVPCVVGAQRATEAIEDGLVITLNGSSGKVYQGGLGSTSVKTSVLKGIERQSSPIEKKIKQAVKGKSVLETATKVYVNLGDPGRVEEIAGRNVDGVGLLRAEFIIANKIKRHPKKIIEEHKEKEFIKELSDNLAVFCRAFNPRPVVYRATDFKTNEYRNLVGGRHYEPEEENPMIGFRGARRYVVNEAVFEMELEAIKRVRNKLDLKNLWLMIPFIRTVKELKQVKKVITTNGLYRSPSFQLWAMVEVPANLFQITEMVEVGIDGVSIGSNDLTMLVLGADRDNEELAAVFDERNPAVMKVMEKIIKQCLKNKISCSICGQAPSLYPSLAVKLVEWGITSISVSPDMIEHARQTVYYAEHRRVK